MKRTTRLVSVLLAIFIIMSTVLACSASATTTTAATTKAATTAPATTAATTAAATTAAPAATTAAATTPATTAAKQQMIGYSNMQLKEDFFITVQKGLKKAAADNKFKFDEAIADRDAAKMKQNIEALVTKGANIIIDFNVLPEAGSAIAGSLKKQNIPMLSVDCIYQDAYFFGVDNMGAGRTLGEFAVEQVKSKFGGTLDFVVILYDAASGDEVKKRCDGVVEKVKAATSLKDNQIVWLDSKADDIKTGTMTKDWLNSHPNAKKVLFVGQNDDRGYAINKVIESEKRIADCLLVSHNADPASIENLQKRAADKNTAWVGTASYNSHLYGKQIVDMASRILKGGKVNQSEYTTVTIVNLNNVGEYVKTRDAVIAELNK